MKGPRTVGGWKYALLVRAARHSKYGARSTPEVEHDENCWIACPHATPPPGRPSDG